MSSTKTRDQLNRIALALEDEAVDPKEARDTVARLGIDVKDMAQKLRAKVADAADVDRKRRIDDARAAYAKELERLERRKSEPKRPREEQLVVLQALLHRAPQSVAMHFHKYESASDEELAELVRSLRHLLDEPEETEHEGPERDGTREGAGTEGAGRDGTRVEAGNEGAGRDGARVKAGRVRATREEAGREPQEDEQQTHEPRDGAEHDGVGERDDE